MELLGAFQLILSLYNVFPNQIVFTIYSFLNNDKKHFLFPKLDYPNYLDIIQMFKCTQILVLAKSSPPPCLLPIFSILTASIFFLIPIVIEVHGQNNFPLTSNPFSTGTYIGLILEV